MKTVLVSEFKAKCIALLKKRPDRQRADRGDAAGRPIARVIPIVTPKKRVRLEPLKRWMEIKGDIIHSIWKGIGWCGEIPFSTRTFGFGAGNSERLERKDTARIGRCRSGLFLQFQRWKSPG